MKAYHWQLHKTHCLGELTMFAAHLGGKWHTRVTSVFQRENHCRAEARTFWEPIFLQNHFVQSSATCFLPGLRHRRLVYLFQKVNGVLTASYVMEGETNRKWRSLIWGHRKFFTSHLNTCIFHPFYKQREYKLTLLPTSSSIVYSYYESVEHWFSSLLAEKFFLTIAVAINLGFISFSDALIGSIIIAEDLAKYNEMHLEWLQNRGCYDCDQMIESPYLST